MKNRIISCTLALVFVVTSLSSCGGTKDTFENFFIALKKFDIAKAVDCISDSSSDYIDPIVGYVEALSEEQKEIAETLCSYVNYSYIGEQQSGASSYDITLTYVDFASLIKTVEENAAVGTGSASDYIREIIDDGRISGQYTKKAEVTVFLSDEGKIPLGHFGVNKDMTRYLGLDTFLRWYSNQR